MYRTYQAAMDSLEPFKAAARFTAGMMRQAWPHQSWPQAAMMGLDTRGMPAYVAAALGALVGGYFLFKNFDRLLGPDPTVCGDNEGSRGLNKVQVIALWLHLLAITGGFALLLH